MVLDTIQMMWLILLETPMQLKSGGKSGEKSGGKTRKKFQLFVFQTALCVAKKGREVTLTFDDKLVGHFVL